jgi:protein disulfide-isomerase A1
MRAGNIRPYLKSQDPVDNTGKTLLTLVGKNYLDIVNDPSSNFFIMIYSNDCGFCRDLAPSWQKLAKEFKNTTDV